MQIIKDKNLNCKFVIGTEGCERIIAKLYCDYWGSRPIFYLDFYGLGTPFSKDKATDDVTLPRNIATTSEAIEYSRRYIFKRLYKEIGYIEESLSEPVTYLTA